MGLGFQVTFDANDIPRLLEFWKLALEYVEQPPPPGFDSWVAFATEMEIPEERWDAIGALVDPEGRGPRLLFLKVPESKSAKNRVHLDIDAGGGPAVPDEERRSRVDRHAAMLLENGATLVERFDNTEGYWVVLRDPEGNELCVQ